MRRSSRKIAVLSLGLAALAGVAGTSACGRRAPAVAGVPEVVDFNFHVRPILSDRCFACHGPDDRARKAGLRFDRKEIAFGKLPSGHRAIVPGRPGRSALVERILSTDPAVHDAGPRVPPHARRAREGDPRALDRAGCRVEAPLGVHPPREARAARGEDRGLGSERDRPVRARDARGEGPAPVAGGGPGDPRPPRDVRPHRAPADARRRSTPSWPTARRTPTRSSSIACSPRRPTASTWRPSGSTSRATPTRTATRTTACGTCGRGGTG